MLIKLIILRDLSQYQPSTNNFKNLSFEGDKRSMEVVWTFSLNFPLALMFLSWLVLLREKVSKWGTQSPYTEWGTSVMNCLHFILWKMHGLGSLLTEAILECQGLTGWKHSTDKDSPCYKYMYVCIYTHVCMSVCSVAQ